MDAIFRLFKNKWFIGLFVIILAIPIYFYYITNFSESSAIKISTKTHKKHHNKANQLTEKATLLSEKIICFNEEINNYYAVFSKSYNLSIFIIKDFLNLKQQLNFIIDHLESLKMSFNSTTLLISDIKKNIAETQNDIIDLQEKYDTLRFNLIDMRMNASSIYNNYNVINFNLNIPIASNSDEESKNVNQNKQWHAINIVTDEKAKFLKKHLSNLEDQFDDLNDNAIDFYSIFFRFITNIDFLTTHLENLLNTTTIINSGIKEYNLDKPIANIKNYLADINKKIIPKLNARGTDIWNCHIYINEGFSDLKNNIINYIQLIKKYDTDEIQQMQQYITDKKLSTQTVK